MASPIRSDPDPAVPAELPGTSGEGPFQTVWETDSRGMNHYQSPSWYRYVGEGVGSSFGEDWLRFYHPEDRERLQTEWQQSLAAGGAHPYDIKVRIRRYDGVYRWFRVQGAPIKTRDGQVVKWTGTCTDIHDRNEAGSQVQDDIPMRAHAKTAASNDDPGMKPALPLVRFGPLERRLFFLVFVGLLPLALLSFATLFHNAQSQKQQLLAATADTMRAIVTAVDSELDQSIAALDALVASPRLAAEDRARFSTEAKELLERRVGWANVVLSDKSGRQLMNVQAPAGASLPEWSSGASLNEVLRTKRAVVGDIVFSPLQKDYVFAVMVPVMRSGEVAYVLSAEIRPDAVRDVLSRQRIPEQGVAVILDRQYNVVARSLNQHSWVGKPPSPGLRRLILEGGTSGITTTLEGFPVYTVVHHSAVTGWSAAIGIPVNVIDGPLNRSYALLCGAILVSVLLGLFAAYLISGTITRPMRELEAAAVAVGQGTAPAIPDTSMSEIRQVALALSAAHTEREKLLQSEREARLLAENASKAKDEFLAMLGHELRNPLAAISTASEILDLAERASLQEAQAKVIIRRQVRHLGRLTDDLLDAGHVILGKISLQRKPLDLAGVVQSVVDTMRNTGRLAGHDLSLSLHPVWVEADSTRIDQVVANLLGNAVKYTPQPGSITVCVGREGDDAVLRVRDSGLGIETALLPRIFDLFVQGQRSLDRAQGGLGIGLTLVRRLVELHGGEVGANSAGPDRGSEFVVRLRAIAAPVQTPPGVAPYRTDIQRKIVVVEDNQDVRATLCDFLQFSGHTVYEADNGRAGVELVLRERADLAFVDIGLPVMDGYGVARAVRERAAHKVRLVAMTGYGSQEDAVRGMEAGFDTYLIKPVGLATLNKIIAEI